MKKILVPIDFSNGTKETMSFSLRLAHLLQSRLLVLNVVDFAEKMTGLRSVNRILQSDAKARMERFLMPYKKKTNIHILHKIVKGEPTSVITRQAEISEVDLIILGAQGEDNEDQYFLGKTAGNLIKFKETPVIAVPKAYVEADIRKILFIFKRLNKSLFEIISPLVDIAKATNAHIHALHLTGSQTGPVAYSPELIFEGISFSYEKLKADSFTEIIREKCAQDEYDMICIIKRKRGFLEYIFESSPTPKEVIDSKVPILFLNDDEI